MFNRVRLPAWIPLLSFVVACGGGNSSSLRSLSESSNCQRLTATPTAWWDGDQLSGGSVSDRSGNNYGGSGTGLVQSSNGKVSQAFSFDGSSAQISVPHASALAPTGAVSVAAWVNGDTASRTTRQQTILSKWGYNSSAFTDTTNATGAWAGYVLGNTDYTGGTFDGRYVYFFPASGSVVWRYDTQSSFSSGASWQSANLAALLGANYSAYIGGVFDGRYVYLAPGNGATTYAARFDTQNGNFTATGWQGSGSLVNVNGCPNCLQYSGAFFDGRYVYYAVDANAAHNNFLRFDTTNTDFSNASAGWGWVNVSTVAGMSAAYTHYLGGAFDGRYIYFAPFGTTNGYVARYDTQSSAFNTGWQGVRLDTVAGLGANYNGFLGAVFDGRYVYFVPYQNAGGQHGYIPRFDTRNGDFTSTGWEGLNVGTGGLLSNNNTGFAGGFFDGRYVYFVPRLAASGNNGYITRYDTTGTFSSVGSWSTVNMAGITGLSAAYVAYRGGAFDGRYIYLAPRSHANLARFDTLGTNASYQLSYAQYNGDGWGNPLPGLTFSVNTSAGLLSASAYTSLSASTWTQVAGTYDGSTVKLYVNGSLAASRAGSGGNVLSSGNSLVVGNLSNGTGYFKGLLDELMLFSSALSTSDISTLYSSGSDGICK